MYVDFPLLIVGKRLPFHFTTQAERLLIKMKKLIYA